MNIEDDHFVGVTEEANFFVCHLHSAVVNICHVFDGLFNFLRTELNLRIGHLNRNKLISLAVQFFFLTLEILEPVANV